MASQGAVPVTIAPFGMYQADLAGQDATSLSPVCPFSDDAKDEDQLGAPHPPPGLAHDPRTGGHSLIAAGRRVAPDDELQLSSSGGLTTWLLGQLLKAGHVDGVIHVGRPTKGGEQFAYMVSSTLDEVTAHRKSQYYSVTMKDALLSVRGDGRRYALVGVPCFIKAARLLADRDDVLTDQLAYYVGIVCGHLKSQHFGTSLAWQVGVPPDQLAEVDFRLKDPARPAGKYDFGARPVGEATFERHVSQELLGGIWGHGAFQPEACNFCDDIFAETADVVFGDAWLPQYEADWRGTNVVVSRNAVVDRLLLAGAADGSLDLEELSVDEACQSQAGNFRHRRDGLAVRLADDISAGLSVPRKRVAPDAERVTPKRRALVRQRRRMSEISLRTFPEALAAGDLARYVKPMRREIARYGRIDRPIHRRVLGRLRRALRK